MVLLLSHLGSFTFKSSGLVRSWLLLSLLFGSAGAVCPLPPVSEGAQLTTITHDGVSRSWYTYVPASVAAAQAVVPLVIDLHAIYQCVTQDDTQLYAGWLSKAEKFGFIAVWPLRTSRSARMESVDFSGMHVDPLEPGGTPERAMNATGSRTAARA